MERIYDKCCGINVHKKTYHRLFQNALPTIWWLNTFQAMKQAYKINKVS